MRWLHSSVPKGCSRREENLPRSREAEELKSTIEAARNNAARETEWIARLMDIRTSKADDPAGQIAESAYAAVFHEAGIDPDLSSRRRRRA